MTERLRLPRPVLAAIGWVMWAGAVAALLARWWPGDRVVALVPVCFAPALFLAALGIAGCVLTRGARIARVIAGAIVGVIALVAYAQEQPNLLARFSDDHSGAPSIRIALYNVESYHGGVDKVAAALNSTDADIIGVLEGTTGGKPPQRLRDVLGAKYQWATVRTLAIATRLPMIESRRIKTRGFGCLRTVVEWQGRPVAVYLVDFPSPTSYPRIKIWDDLEAIIETEDLPHLVLGDLNTPRQSRALREVFANYHDAALAPAAPRYLATWPWCFPLWQIDHIFGSRELLPVSEKFFGGMISDHHGVVAEVGWAEAAGSPRQ